MIKIEDFAKIDLRVGKILEAEEIEKARGPMYRLAVDLGSKIGVRVIVAGIKNRYAKETLIGKKIVCVVNLEPKMIAGIESHGMLLAAGEEEGTSLLVPDKEIKAGSRIH